MKDPQTWNDLVQQCADLQAENDNLKKEIKEIKNKIKIDHHYCKNCRYAEDCDKPDYLFCKDHWNYTSPNSNCSNWEAIKLR